MKKKSIVGILPLFILFSVVFAIDPLPPLRVITVTKPVANAAFTVGHAIAISWTCKGAVGNSVKIRVVPQIEPQAAQVIVASTANDGAYSWTPAAAFPGKVWIEVQSLDGLVTGKSGLFAIAPAGGGDSDPGTHNFTYPINRVFHNSYGGELFDPLQILGSYVIKPGMKMTVRLNLGITPSGFGFATRAWFPNNGCPNDHARVNGTCYPFSPGADPAVREQVFSSQWIAENGQICQLKLYIYGTMPAGDYQISGNVQVTLAR